MKAATSAREILAVGPAPSRMTFHETVRGPFVKRPDDQDLQGADHSLAPRAPFSANPL
jgi:hypothetical protein